MHGQSAERLKEYHRKRDFRRTLEPSGADAAVDAGCLYVMHHHAASHDHYDLRLEENGVLRSWALPKGASLEPGEKRLAIEVEDHPLEYGGFEGVIPHDQYGGGTVMLWDAGSWRVNGKNKEGHLDFVLDGQKLKGAWTLVRMRGGRGKQDGEKKNWLLIKRSDAGGRKLRPGDASVATGRSMDEIARDRDNAWLRGELPATPVAAEIANARKQAMSQIVRPQLASLADRAPAGDEWIHEIKVDGYRVLARLDGKKAKLLTRNDHDWTRRFPELAVALQRLPAQNAILDGEVAAITNDGSTSFRKLQEALSAGETANLVYQVFDLLYLDGHDLAGVELLERKRALRQLLAAAGFSAESSVRYADHVQGRGPEFFGHACQLGLEGILSKRAHAPYRGGRNRQWLKVKCTHHEEFVIGGYTPPGGSRQGFGSLLLGTYEDDDFVYAGRVGTGFSARQLDELHAMLKRLATPDNPFNGSVPDERSARWVKPELVIEVEFTERTRDGRLRHPVFRGLRDDRDPAEIRLMQDIDMREETSSRTAAMRDKIANVRFTHPDKIMYPEAGVTKRDIADYYEEIRDWILPQLAGRPLSLLRCPDGWRQTCFFQKHPGAAIAQDVPRVSIEESKGVRQYVYVRSIADIVALVQVGTLEFHPWGTRADDVEHPDLMVFDLDPAPEVPWSAMLRAARGLHERLDALGLPAFPRVTGGKGLHLVVPLRPRASWDEIRNFAKAVANSHAGDDPKHFTASMSKAKRRGRIFIDYLRNGRGATAIASYSLRARENAPVAVPLRWDELNAALRPNRYTIENLRRRLGALQADPWRDFDSARVVIDAGMRKRVGLER